MLRALLLAAAFFAVPAAASAADSSASPSPSPEPTPGVSVLVNGSNSFVSTGASGAGVTPPEAPGFAKGSPLSPMTPYDWFSGAPTTPGNALQSQYIFTIAKRTHHTVLSISSIVGAYAGDTNTLLYWGEPWAGPINPHLGVRAPIDTSIYFPTHAGARDAFLLDATLLSTISYGASDDRYRLTAGLFNLHQTDRFVFAPPATLNVVPTVGIATAETLGPGMPSLDRWNASPVTLPLQGADAYVQLGAGTAEVAYARLPSLLGTTARALVGSYVLDRGDGGRFSAEVAHTYTGGDEIGTTTYYGQNQTLLPGPQGRLFTSTLGDQHQTIVGVRALFHPQRGYDALVELGASSYHSNGVAKPGSAQTGTFEHVGLARHFTSDASAGLDYYRADPRYGTIILPYGFQENIWSVAWSWPGNWLKSTYQSVDNSIVAVNREGFRAHVDYAHGRAEVHASAQAYRQIQPVTLTNAAQEGWVEGFFLPQFDTNATIAWQRQVNLYTAWHLQRDDLVVDSVWDRSYRPSSNDPLDLVSMTYPEAVVSWQHHWNKVATAVVGYGRYGAHGDWGTTPVNDIYDVAFIGGQWDFGNGQQLLVHLRHYTTHGLPSAPGGLSPNNQGTTLLVDHRISRP